MPRLKYDGVVEAVRYKPNGEVDWVRAYERRGPTFSDVVLIDRESLIKRLKRGQRFVTGRRLSYLASTFEVFKPLRLVNNGDREVLVAGDSASESDSLDGVPVI